MTAILPDGTLIAVTNHAAEQWHYRIEPERPYDLAWGDAEQDLCKAVEIPWVLARKFHPFIPRVGGTLYYVTRKALFVVPRGEVVSTVYPFSDEAIYCVLVRLLTGSLPPDFPVWRDLFD